MHLFERFMFRRSRFVSALLNDSGERTSTSGESLDLQEWVQRINSAKVDQTHSDELVLDFLLHENHKRAAKQFQKDTGLNSHKTQQLELKEKVSSMIQNLQIDSVEEFFTDLCKEKFEQDKVFQAELALLKLFRLAQIRDIPKVLDLAKTEVFTAVKGKKSLEKLFDLILASVLWTHPTEEYPFIEEIRILIEEVNDKAIDWLNQHLNSSRDSHLVNLVRQVRWMEDRLGKRKVLPRLEEIGDGVFSLAGDSSPRSSE